MDRSWMYEAPRPVLGGLFMTELANFIEKATEHAEREGRTEIYCPCIDCKNQKLWQDKYVIKSHLVKRGFVEGYTRWIRHGEMEVEVDNAGKEYETSAAEMEYGTKCHDTGTMDVGPDFEVEEMLRHVEP